MKDKLELNLIFGGKVYNSSFELPKKSKDLNAVLLDIVNGVTQDIYSLQKYGTTFETLTEEDKEALEEVISEDYE